MVDRFSNLVGLFLGILWLVLCVPVGAFELRTGKTVLIPQSERIEGDLYVAAEILVIDGWVRGDVVAVGREIRINGRVDGDLLVVGQVVSIVGRVGDDARVAGMVVTLAPGSQIVDHIVSFAYSFEAKPESRVGAAILSGYQIVLGGEVVDTLRAAAAAISLEGPVGGVARVKVGSGGGSPGVVSMFLPVSIPTLTPGLTISDSAVLQAGLEYQSAEEAVVARGAHVEGLYRLGTEGTLASEPTPGERLLGHLRDFLVLAVIGFLLLWIAPRWSAGMVDRITNGLMQSALWGIAGLVAVAVGLIALPVVVILLAFALGYLGLGTLMAVVVIGGLLAEGALGGATWAFATLVAPVVLSLVIGCWLVDRLWPQSRQGPWLELLCGLIVLSALRLVPFIAPLAWIFAVLCSLGAVCRGSWSSRRSAAARPAGA